VGQKEHIYISHRWQSPVFFVEKKIFCCSRN